MALPHWYHLSDRRLPLGLNLHSSRILRGQFNGTLGKREIKLASFISVLSTCPVLSLSHDSAAVSASEGRPGYRWSGHLEEQASAPQPRGQAALPEHLWQEHHHLHWAVHHEPQPLHRIQQTRYTNKLQQQILYLLVCLHHAA